jgi:DNA-binding GntR family transcriptional regulator
VHREGDQYVTTMSKSEAAYVTLRERILGGAYAPGQRLVLSDLASELGTSSVPVREALRRLEAEGWLTFRPNVGVEIRPVNPMDWVAMMDVLAILEGRATALAAPHLTAGDLERARARNQAARTAVEQIDPVAVSECNRDFHRIICAPCPNAYLRQLTRQTAEKLDAMRHTMFGFVPERTRAVLDEHDRLLALIEEGASADAVERYAREHKLSTVAAYLARAAPDAATPPSRVSPAAQ